jgi:hypothetical protein
MNTYSSGRVDDVYDVEPDFVYAVSLLAALEGATGQAGHHAALPFLGMARAELVDYGQRRPSHYLDVEVGDFHDGLVELDGRLALLRASSPVLQETLRIEAARRLVRQAMTAAG